MRGKPRVREDRRGPYECEPGEPEPEVTSPYRDDDRRSPRPTAAPDGSARHTDSASGLRRRPLNVGSRTAMPTERRRPSKSAPRHRRSQTIVPSPACHVRREIEPEQALGQYRKSVRRRDRQRSDTHPETSSRSGATIPPAARKRPRPCRAPIEPQPQAGWRARRLPVYISGLSCRMSSR